MSARSSNGAIPPTTTKREGNFSKFTKVDDFVLSNAKDVTSEVIGAMFSRFPQSRVEDRARDLGNAKLADQIRARLDAAKAAATASMIAGRKAKPQPQRINASKEAERLRVSVFLLHRKMDAILTALGVALPSDPEIEE